MPDTTAAKVFDFKPYKAKRGEEYMNDRQLPYALVMRKGSVAPVELVENRELRTCQNQSTDRAEASTTRREMLQAIQAATFEDDLVIASTGYTGRELYGCADRHTTLSRRVDGMCLQPRSGPGSRATRAKNRGD